ncbi:hypothetical protein ACQPXB_32875 [Amycolatopsis sp. CA-161197]|uniref:hypothetical protein n=1 Tax=Amycolatopsis sp. CA-161197 TaxID=3239922 RepID=UPI003D8FA941
MTNPATPQDLEAARLLLSRLGVDPADLVTAGREEPVAADTEGDERPMPTIREWIPVVAGLVSRSTSASYGSCWNKAEAEWGDRAMDTITASEIKALSELVRSTALVRRNSRGGRNAAENFVAAVAVSTGTWRTTGASIGTATRPAGSPSRAAMPPPAAHCRTSSWLSSTTSSPARAMTRSWTR